MKNNYFKKLLVSLFLIVLFCSYPKKVFSLGLGQCHTLGAPGYGYSSWAYRGDETVGWGYIEPERGYFNFSQIEKDIQTSRNAGKKLWIQILTSAAEGFEVPSWAQNMGVEVIKDTSHRAVPTAACWDSEYLSLFGATLKKFAERYDSPAYQDVIEAVIIAGCGAYGEMAIPPTDISGLKVDNPYVISLAQAYGKTPQELIQRNCDCGNYQCYCFDYYYIKSVERMIDLYMQYFTNTPAVIQLGNGLTGQGIVNVKVMQYALCTYGDRVWTKFNGWGPGRSNPRGDSNFTRVGFEPGPPWSPDLVTPENISNLVNGLSGASYLCLQPDFYTSPSDYLFCPGGGCSFSPANLGSILGRAPVPRPMTSEERQQNCQNLITPEPIPSPIPYECPNEEKGNLNCDPWGWVNDEDLNLLFENWKESQKEKTLHRLLSFWSDVTCNKTHLEINIFPQNENLGYLFNNVYEKYVEFTPQQDGRLKEIKIYAENNGNASRSISCKIVKVFPEETMEDVERSERETRGFNKGVNWITISFEDLPIRLRPLLIKNQVYRLYCTNSEPYPMVKWTKDVQNHSTIITTSSCSQNEID